MEQTRPPKLNAATHWMTARQTLIPGETRESLQAHLNHWNALYPGVETDELLFDLVGEAAFSHWLLLRNQRHYDAAIAALHRNPMENWTPQDHNTFQLRERYLNAAKRNLHRDRSHILQYQASLRAQAREDRSASDYAEVQGKKPGKREPDPRAKPINNNPVMQVATIRHIDGQTKTILWPDNLTMLNHMASLRYETTLVYRSLRFENHYVPPEYREFAERTAHFKDFDRDRRVVQTLTFRSLRIAIEREKEFGGHIRDWPDLRADDEHAIQFREDEVCQPKE